MERDNLIFFIIVIILITAGIFYSKSINSKVIDESIIVHEHADFIVYLNGEPLNFAHAIYMVRDKKVHIEDMIGDKIHKHAEGITLDYFFNSLGFKFNENCFVLDNGENYCNQGEKTLKFYVNGIENYEYGDYEISDGEEYLISYGDDSEEEIQRQLDL